jgi:hypothetical protein
MAQRPKAKPKSKDKKNTDTEQSERFTETARRLEVDESGKAFERAFTKLVPPKKRFQA